jgi:hypothetical protein
MKPRRGIYFSNISITCIIDSTGKTTHSIHKNGILLMIEQLESAILHFENRMVLKEIKKF